MKQYFILFLSLSIFSVTAWSNQVRLSEVLRTMDSKLELALSNDFTQNQLKSFLGSIYAQAYGLDFRDVDIQDLKSNSDDYIQRLFQIQTQFQSTLLSKWNNQGLLEDPETLEAYYNILRTVRYSIDMVGEAKYDFPQLTGDEELETTFENGKTSMVLGGDPNSLSNGTVYLVRGTAANSAAIARISNFTDGQFSHIGFLHINSEGEKSIIEALIEKGLVKNTYDYAMNHGVARAQAFIYEDLEVQSVAANYANIFASSNIHYPYNFTMKTTPFDTAVEDFFCSDVIRYSFGAVTEGELTVPLHPSVLPMTDFTMSLGVEASETFAPSDIQSDSRFAPGPEWRDFRFTEKVRHQDLILDHMLEALNSGWYAFEAGPKFFLGSSITKFLSRMPLARKLPLLRDIPENMSRKTLQQVLMLHFSTENIFKRVKQWNQDFISEHGVPMSPKQINNNIDKMLRTENAFGPFKKAKPNPASSNKGMLCESLLD